MNQKDKEELQKCKDNPYYFATTYLLINGKPFATLQTEEEFNANFPDLYDGYIKGRTKSRFFTIKPELITSA